MLKQVFSIYIDIQVGGAGTGVLNIQSKYHSLIRKGQEIKKDLSPVLPVFCFAN